MEKSRVKAKDGLVPVKPSIRHVDEAINRLFAEVSPLIAAARERAAVVVNAELTNLNWNIGDRINREILGFSRAEYGKQVIRGLAHKLMLFHGSEWDEKTLRHCLRVAETFGKDEIVSATRRQNEEHVELLEMWRSNIRVATYMTELPPKKILEAKFRHAIESVRNRLVAKMD